MNYLIMLINIHPIQKFFKSSKKIFKKKKKFYKSSKENMYSLKS